MAAPTFSIKSKFDGAVVFITGATGYIGSVVLEQLLRTTNVGKVYLLMRPRRGEDIQQRLNKLLQGALFHKVCCFRADKLSIAHQQAAATLVANATVRRQRYNMTTVISQGSAKHVTAHLDKCEPELRPVEPGWA